jgi:hypothetical protein
MNTHALEYPPVGTAVLSSSCPCLAARGSIYDSRRAKRLGFGMDGGRDKAALARSVETFPDYVADEGKGYIDRYCTSRRGFPGDGVAGARG